MKNHINRYMSYPVEKIVAGSENKVQVGDVHLLIDKINTTHTQRQCKRKFPGPAGILPPPNAPDNHLKDNQSMITNVGQQVDNKKLKIKDEPTATDIFSSEVWRSLVADLGPDSKVILDKFSIRFSLLKASKKLLHRGKIALILGVIDNLDLQGSDISFVIRDPTGKMKGSLHHDIMKDYESVLHSGSVLILRQVSVISPSPRTHYLNVTPANIVLVYTADRNNGLIKHMLQNAKLNDSSPERIKSLKDIVKESENELNMSLHYLREHCTSTSGIFPDDLFLAPAKLSSPVTSSTPVRLSTPVRMSTTVRQYTHVRPSTPVSVRQSTPVRQSVPVRSSLPELSTSSLKSGEAQKTCANKNMHLTKQPPKSSLHNPARNNEKALFSSSAVSSAANAALGNLNQSRNITNLSIQPTSSSAPVVSNESMMFLLDDDSELLEMCDMCDIYTEPSNNIMKVLPTCPVETGTLGQHGSSNKQHAVRTGSDSTDGTVVHTVHENNSSGKKMLGDNQVSKTSLQVTQPKNSPFNSAEINVVERDSRIQLKHTGPAFVAPEQLLPHWEDDPNLDLLLSQMSEDF